MRLARERHARDLETGHERGLWFDTERADHVCGLFATLRHSKGEWAGQPFILSDWQSEDIIRPVFGWMKLPEGMTPKQAAGYDLAERLGAGIYRRFRTVYESEARKQGKSTKNAGVGLILLAGDGEDGAEVYNAATKRDQARIVHSEAVNMVRSSPRLRKMIRVVRDNLSLPEKNSKFEPLAKDARTMDGLNPSGVLIDEYHAHTTSEVFDVLTTGLGARRQPLTWIITTAGLVRDCPCYQEELYAKSVLEGHPDDSYFAIVYTLDDDDDWEDPAVWGKANPNLGVTVREEDLAAQVQKAKASPAYKNTVLTKHFNIWTDSKALWLNMELWDAICDADPVAWRAEAVERHKGHACMAGLDLGSVSDLTAFVLFFRVDDGYDCIPYFWIPEDGAKDRDQSNRQTYIPWIHNGFIQTTPGNTTDYSVVRKKINELADWFGVKDIAMDRFFQGDQLGTELLNDDGLEVVGFGQGFASMAAPTKRFEELVLSGKLQHGNNPVLRWMASHTMVKLDPAGCMKPDKAESGDKIDGIVSAIMALGRWMVDEQKGSVYEERGPLFF